MKTIIQWLIEIGKNPSTLSFWLLRLWLGFRALLTGVEKFSGFKIVQEPLLDEAGNPDITGAIVVVKYKFYALGNYHGLPDSLLNTFKKEPLLHPLMLNAFITVLGPLLLLTGGCLLLGLFTRLSLYVMGLLYISLTFGLIMINQNDGVSALAVHVALCAYALHLSAHNKLEIIR